MTDISLPDRLSRLWRSPARLAFQPTLGLGLSGGAWQLPVRTRLDVPPLQHMRLVVNLAPLRSHEFWADGVKRRGGPSSRGAIRIAPHGETGRAEVDGDAFAFAQVYIPTTALEQAVRDHAGGAGTAALGDPLFNGEDQLATALVLALMSPAEGQLDALYRDHLALTLIVHLVHRYGSVRKDAGQGELSRRKAQLVQQLMHEAIEPGISLAELANAAGLSTFHFARSFKRTFGVPPHAYLLRLRIDHAKRMLKNHALAITDVALACGYATPSAFASAFRRETGVSPSQWRRGS